MVFLLDEYIFVVLGSEINDDLFNFIFCYVRELMEEKGDDILILWLYCDECFVEKLVILDVIVVDLIGDVDFIKVVNLKLIYVDDCVIYFGMIFCVNWCIFVINEFLDL